MARGRMINSAICMDKRVNELSDDTSRLAFTWLITFADCEGRTHGDPALLCSTLFPRRRDIDNERMETYIRQWADLGLVIWYEAEDDLWIEFPAFEKNQPGLRKEREPKSTIPSPSNGKILAGCLPDVIQQSDGVEPENIPHKLSEQKLSEEKRSETPRGDDPLSSSGDSIPTDDPVAKVFQSWSDINPRRQITPLDADMLKGMIADHGAPEVVTAIAKANAQGKPYLAYVQGILKNNGQRGSPGKAGQPAQRVVNIGERYA